MGRVMSAKERAELKRLARAGVVVESAPCDGCAEKKRKPKVTVVKEHVEKEQVLEGEEITDVSKPDGEQSDQ